jgi:hypothetical protein
MKRKEDGAGAVGKRTSFMLLLTEHGERHSPHPPPPLSPHTHAICPSEITGCITLTRRRRLLAGRASILLPIVNITSSSHMARQLIGAVSESVLSLCAVASSRGQIIYTRIHIHIHAVKPRCQPCAMSPASASPPSDSPHPMLLRRSVTANHSPATRFPYHPY